MFPIPFNFPFIKKNGERTTIGDAINNSGSQYTLPTASADTKGGVKIGSGLTMTGDVLNATGGSGGTVDKEHMRYIVETDTDFIYYVPLSKEYIGSGQSGYEIKTHSASGADASVDIFYVIYENGVLVDKTLIRNLDYTTASSNPYSNEDITVSYSSSSWRVVINGTLVNVAGTTYTSPVTWAYSETVDHIMLHPVQG